MRRRAHRSTAAVAAMAWATGCVPSDGPARPTVALRPEARSDTPPRPTGHADVPSVPDRAATSLAATVRPVENLSPLWRLDGDWVIADAGARYAVFDRLHPGGTDVAIVDVACGAIVATAQGWRDSLWLLDRGGYWPSLVHEDLVATWRDHATLVALDATTGRERWRAPLEFIWTPLPTREGAAGVVLFQHVNEGLVALDAATGRERWRWPLQPRTNTVAATDAQRAFVIGADRALHALELATGREAWRWSPPASPYSFWQVAVVGDAVVFTDGEGDATLDAATGRTRAPWRTDPARPRTIARVVAAAGHLVRAVDGDPRARRNDDGATVGLSLTTALGAWRRPDPFLTAAAGTDAAYTCTEGGVLRALDPTTGAERWTWGLERCEQPWPSHRPWFRVARSTAAGDVALVRTRHGTTALARADAPSPPEVATITGRATVNGRPRPGLAVRVGDGLARTDAQGRFRYAVTQRGGVVVRITDRVAARAAGRPCGFETRAWVPLTGAGRYRVRIDGIAAGYECDRACHCD